QVVEVFDLFECPAGRVLAEEVFAIGDDVLGALLSDRRERGQSGPVGFVGIDFRRQLARTGSDDRLRVVDVEGTAGGDDHQEQHQRQYNRREVYALMRGPDV